MGTGDFDVDLRVHGSAVTPIHDSIVARVDGSFEHRVGHSATQRIDEVAGAASGIAVGKNAAAMFLKNPETNRFCRVKDRSIGESASDGSGKRDHGRDVSRPLTSHRTRDHASEAVADEVDLAARLGNRFFDRLVQAALDQQVGTLCIDADSRKIRAVPDAFEPCVQLCQVKIGTEKPGDNNYSRAVPARDTQAVVNGSRVKQQDFSPEQCLCPEWCVDGWVAARD